jgi:hypothetical protein
MQRTSALPEMPGSLRKKEKLPGKSCGRIGGGEDQAALTKVWLNGIVPSSVLGERIPTCRFT